MSGMVFRLIWAAWRLGLVSETRYAGAFVKEMRKHLKHGIDVKLVDCVLKPQSSDRIDDHEAQTDTSGEE